MISSSDINDLTYGMAVVLYRFHLLESDIYKGNTEFHEFLTSLKEYWEIEVDFYEYSHSDQTTRYA